MPPALARPLALAVALIALPAVGAACTAAVVAPCHLVTNFAVSGRTGEGAGYLRHDRELELFAGFGPGPADWRTVLHTFTRDLGHVLLDHPSWDEVRQAPAGRERWIHTRHTIDRDSTSAAVVIVGRRPGETWPPATMWVIPGEPVTAVAVPLWVEAGASPAALHEGAQAPLWRESLRLKALARPLGGPEREEYLNLTRLDNVDGTGWLPRLLATEQETLDATAALLTEPRTTEELKTFEDQTAKQVLTLLSGIR